MASTYLKEKGYFTIGIDWIGLWFKKGFDYYGEGKDTNSFYNKIKEVRIVKKILLNLPSSVYDLGKKVKNTIKPKESLFVSAKSMVDLAISKINYSKKVGKPFFLFIHFEDTHFPYPNVSLPKNNLSGKDDVKRIFEKIKNSSQKEYVKKRLVDIQLHSLSDIKAKYDLAISNIDKEIGRLANNLKKANSWENTLFIVLSDHGDSIDEHGIYFSHSGLFDESFHVPLIIKFPKSRYGGRRIKSFVQNIDILPTVLQTIGSKQERYDGKSLIPLIKSGKKIRDKVFLFDGLAEDAIGVRTKDKKLIVAKKSKCNLCKTEHHKRFEEYDLKKDPKELNDIYSGKSSLMRFLK